MKKTKQAFSMVELIISISIIIIISVIAVTSTDSVKDKSNNTKILSDVETLRNGFQAYSQEKSEYPTPKGNLQFYGDDTGYRHSYEQAFGVSGFVTEDTLPKKYLNNLPLDPKTGQYYAYGKTKNTNHFEIAGVIFENNTPTSFVAGNWKGEFGPYNLVKEYAGPNFVYDKGTEYFPYNPYEKMLVAKIASYSGVLLINDKTMTNTEIFSYNLGQGDKISIGTGGTANVYYSDGSNSVLGDMNSKSEVVLAHMKFVEDNNLFTSVKLALNVGSLWTKASKLSDKSDFEVYTIDAVAAVRGTVFGMKKDTGISDIVVQEGKVEIKDISLNSGESLNNIIKNGQSIGTSFTPSQSAGVIEIEDNKSYIEVLSGSGSKGVRISSDSINILPISSTGSIARIPTEGKENIIDNIPEINEGQEIEIISYSALSGITIKNSPTLQKVQKLILKKDSTGIIPLENTGTNQWTSSGDINLSFTGGLYKINAHGNIGIGKYELSFCKEKNGKNSCSKTISLDINDTTDYIYNEAYIDTCIEDVDRFYNSVFNRNPYKIECKEILDSFIDEQKKVGYNEKNKTDLKIELIKKTLKGDDCITYKKKFGKNSLDGYPNCQLIALNTYRWKKGVWSTCNLGNQIRAVECIKNDGSVVIDNNCSGLKPIESQLCGSFYGDGSNASPWRTNQVYKNCQEYNSELTFKNNNTPRNSGVCEGKACLEDGIYLVNPDGIADIKVYCNMTQNDGGWTLALKADGNQSTFAYDGVHWTNNVYLSAENPLANQYKGYFYDKVSTQKVMIQMDTSGQSKFMVINEAGDTIKNLVSSSGKSISHSKSDWLGLINGSSLQPNCNQSVWNFTQGVHLSVRIGIMSNEQNDECNSHDSVIGIGIGDGNLSTSYLRSITKSSVGNFCTANGTNCSPTKDIKSIGYIYVK